VKLALKQQTKWPPEPVLVRDRRSRDAQADAFDGRGLFSGLIRLHVLHHAATDGIFGLGIIDELARYGYKLSPGTLYPILHSLEEKGLLSSGEEVQGGKIRRVYRATPAGRKALAAAKEKVQQLFGELFEDERRISGWTLVGRRRAKRPQSAGVRRIASLTSGPTS
jgi:PadR family transcriptional regulator, regulatory protein PadR